MILLDTNVVSELMKSSPDAAVAAWARLHPLADSYLSAITLAELRFGCARLPPGERKVALSRSIDDVEKVKFFGRVLPFDLEMAEAFGEAKAQRERQGRPIDDADAVIAATAIVHRFALATRNVKDFEALGFELINPFRAGD